MSLSTGGLWILLGGLAFLIVALARAVAYSNVLNRSAENVVKGDRAWYTIADGAGWAMFAAGLIILLQGSRAWAHDDDIEMMVMITVALIWSSVDGFPTVAMGTTVKYEPPAEEKDKKVWMAPNFGVHAGVRMLLNAGGWLALMFIVRRGRSDNDRIMAIVSTVFLILGTNLARGMPRKLEWSIMNTFSVLLVLAFEVVGWSLMLNLMVITEMPDSAASDIRFS